MEFPALLLRICIAETSFHAYTLQYCCAFQISFRHQLVHKPEKETTVCSILSPAQSNA